MEEGNIQLSQIFVKNNIDINYKIDSLFVKNVKFYRKNLTIEIILESNEIIDEKVLEYVKSILKSQFYNFNISLIVEYNIQDSIENIIDIYWGNILYLIKEEIPSSSSWIDDLSYKFKDGTLTIYGKNRIINYALEKNKIPLKIKRKIIEEFNVDIEVKLDKTKVFEDEDAIIKQTIEEEKEISLETLNNSNNSNKKNVEKKSINSNLDYVFGQKIDGSPIKIKDITSDTGTAIICGEIFQLKTRDIRGNRKLVTFNITDFTDSMTIKVFLTEKQFDEFIANIHEDLYVKVEGDIIFDNFSKHLVLMLKSLNILEKIKREDNCKDKRVELHLHTQMSAMDGISSFESLAKRAKSWGHKAIAITDHGVVQGFPEAMEVGEKLDLKIIYGVEGYLINDNKPIVINYEKGKDYNTYVVFDIETTGLSPINDKITEIGAVKIREGVIIDEFSQLVNPGIPIPNNIVNITGITDEMVSDKPRIEEVLPCFEKFIQNSVLVAHNASFDIGFIREEFLKLGKILDNPVLDTLELTRALFPQLKKYKLDVIAKYLNVDLVNHHRAIDDARATGEIFLKCMNILDKNHINNFYKINKLSTNKNISKEKPYHIIILAKNQKGLKNLYKLISESHLNYFYRRPRIPKSLLSQYRDGLIIGSACEAGELYSAILRNMDVNEIKNIVNFYDYLEIQPIGNNMHLLRNGIVKDENELRRINQQIVEIGDKFNKPVVATGDVHFLDPEDEIFRKILMTGQGYSDADFQPPLYFKTTEEMLEEFKYLGKEKAEEVVIKNSNLIANQIENIKPIPEGTYPPIIEGADEELKKITYNRAMEIYGDPLPDIVKERLDKELNSIINNGYAVMYIIAQKLVWKSLKDGYLVGSRGSVGSSFVATMSGITEVNPLVPHYVCPKCKYSEFIEDGPVGSGVDLPNKVCPKCGTLLKKDGHDIPFEVFLGFEGDKEPDIDLNFAGEYQSQAHKYTEELFGKGYVFRAGTIGTIAEKTAYGFVKKYHEQKGISVHPAEINRLVQGCSGIKRTSGQHPGGVMIVPKYKDIHDFTPIQYPADDKESGVITTHFDYNSISGRILKLDILGHDVPTIIRMLEDITGVDAKSIPLDDKETMKLFTSTEPLGIDPKDINTDVGTLGIPEFGTKFVRQMLIDTQPNTFSELVRISGLSHGTDVWLNNAQNLVRNGTATLNQVISTRDDIMLYLIHLGLDKKKSFKIMENVRKGRGLSEEDEEYMRSFNVPDWYINSCKKIKYMFPKAHAVAYVMMSFRIAYFKVHYPEAFYATYFTTKAQDFDAQLVLKGKGTIDNKIKELENNLNNLTAKEKNQLTVLEVVQEMYARGLNFEKVQLYKSHSDKFIIGDKGIIPPLKSLEGVGETVARKIVQERNIAEFLSIEDLISRAKVNKTALEALREHGCLLNLPESNQISLFNI
ncbi:DNA polymerase-3 subunit alpha (Gram-positive type) [Keratinibaculum paraultunense]|uniref:DNA polymerase III PolC-type n=1 Tax=Keratinibaculum paraultunense TaxID=1278232 RepID=A0A4R3KX18_9FIRM|nr:PolC-type DNA polymerase III [Keratinibaculum paraultunense]QQY80700.1 PolC-type DNA polymerase III [Keratinibaculum paraultunense]TCS89696.1 DNA polymerase-3 subunit alpha (Gram-positive type) [Keratinibaculum paraultunense]